MKIQRKTRQWQEYEHQFWRRPHLNSSGGPGPGPWAGGGGGGDRRKVMNATETKLVVHRCA